MVALPNGLLLLLLFPFSGLLAAAYLAAALQRKSRRSRETP